MKNILMPLTVTLLFLLCYAAMAHAYAMRDSSLDNYQEPNYEALRQYLLSNRKRSCIRRGSSCDHRPSDCCFNSSCRCNLWGTNCRCQRAGLFQKWGK